MSRFRTPRLLAVAILTVLVFACCPRTNCCPTTPAQQQMDPDDPFYGPPTEASEIDGGYGRVDMERVDALVMASPCDSIIPEDEDVIRALTASTVFQNEVHDCQRLVVIAPGGVPEFGPLAGLFPNDSSMGLKSFNDFGSWVPVANVLNWGDFDYDPQRYAPLGLRDGWSCLWLRADGPDDWSAVMDTTACADHPAPTFLHNVSLSVNVHRHQGGPAVYPRTARWGWDGEWHYIGIKCGLRWCTIGRTGFQPTEASTISGMAHRTLPGWFDSQHLATNVAGETHVRPGPWATIYPSRDHYDARNDDAQMRSLLQQGFVGARIEIPTDQTSAEAIAGISAYETKFNLAPRDGAARTDVWVQVIGETDGPQTAVFWSENGRDPGNNWYRAHKMHAASGAVRWRWHDTDETAWLSCRAGCCDVQP
jgi:hypothetical protein